MNSQASEPRGVIFYDSDCLFCNHFVNFIVQRDQLGVFRFTSSYLLSQAGSSDNLSYLKKINEETILLLYKGRFYKRAFAIIKIASLLGWKYQIFFLLYAIPSPLLNGIYDLVAKYRKKLITNTKSCLLPQNSPLPARLLSTSCQIKPYVSTLQPIFLTAMWQNLVIVSYEVDPMMLRPFLPLGTELDAFEGRHYVSLVCYQFTDTKIMGLAVPFHNNFTVVNLRFYVKRRRYAQWERGVVFIKQFVPKPAFCWVVNSLYNENYQVAHMQCQTDKKEDSTSIEHIWVIKNKLKNKLKVTVFGDPMSVLSDSLHEHITDHYFGYVKQRDQSTKEFEVRHPPWRVWHHCYLENLQVNFESLFGRHFAFLDATTPSSLFVAGGSRVSVHKANDIYF